MRSDWIQLDDLRESWIFLILGNTQNDNGPDDPEPLIEYWEIGVGNPDHLLNSEAEHLENPRIRSETDLLDTLLAELSKYRYQDTTLVTSHEGDVRALRKWMLQRNNPQATLRGFNHVNIELLLDRYFDANLSDYGLDKTSRTPPRIREPNHDEIVGSGAIEEVRDFWTDIFRLIPPEDLEGKIL